MTDLALIWAAFLAFAVFAYVVLDGFDLGIGMLAPFARSDAEEETMISSIAPVWDGNETWLVLGGGGLMAAFPLAYAVLLPALYAPLIAMLLALIFRGVAFEFRHRHERHLRLWTWGFVLGSYVAAFAQGVALGTVIQGVTVEGRAYAGGWFDWLTPFSLFTGVAVLAGYALLGACFLIMKTEGALQERMFRFAPPLAAAVLIAIAGVSLWTPLFSSAIAERWFSLAEHRVPVARAAFGRGARARPLSRDRGPAGDLALRHRHPALPRLLCGAGREPLPLRRAALHHDLGRCGAE